MLEWTLTSMKDESPGLGVSGGRPGVQEEEEEEGPRTPRPRSADDAIRRGGRSDPDLREGGPESGSDPSFLFPEAAEKQAGAVLCGLQRLLFTSLEVRGERGAPGQQKCCACSSIYVVLQRRSSKFPGGPDAPEPPPPPPFQRDFYCGPCTVSGDLPTWIQGTLYRSGPGLWEVGERQLRHTYDGEGHRE